MKIRLSSDLLAATRPPGGTSLVFDKLFVLNARAPLKRTSLSLLCAYTAIITSYVKIVYVQKHTQIQQERALPLAGKPLSSLDSQNAVGLITLIQDKKKDFYMAQQNLFIGNLSFDTNDDTLKAFFEQIGEVVSARVITDRESGRSKGFGFVEYKNEDDNQKAVDQLNGKELDGRPVSVSLARPKEERPRRESNNGGGSFRQRSW